MRKNKGGSFIDRYLAHILVIPALLLIAIFSLYPIVQSVTYSLFDYQVNVPQKNGMFFDNRFNIDEMNIKVEFIDYYYLVEIIDSSAVQDAENADEIVNQIENLVSTMKEKYANILDDIGNKSGIVKVSNKQLDEIQELKVLLETETQAINEQLNVEDEDLQLLVDSIDAIVASFDDTIITNNFTGFKNYQKALKDTRLWLATMNTLFFTVISVSFELILGIMLALIMNKAMRGRGIVRTMSLIPWAIPTSVAALMWRYLYDGDAGFVSHLLHQLHVIDDPSQILNNAFPSMLGVIFADVWKTTPYMALMLLAGLQTIPNELYESSSIDGANRFQQFTRITLPLLKPSILVALLFRTLDAFRVHDLIQVLTGGGPGKATESLSIYSYRVMKSNYYYGYGSTIVLFMALMVGIISFIYIKVLGAKVRDD